MPAAADHEAAKAIAGSADKPLVSADEREWSRGMAGKRAAKDTDTRHAAAQAGAGPTVVVLPPDCRMAALPALKAELEGASAADAVVLDGQPVERVDTAALQLLALFCRERNARGGTLAWRDASDVLNEAAGLLGLAQILELPAATPA
jgi:anti-anti-sigma regulatory factor